MCWYGHVMGRKGTHACKKVMNMTVAGWKNRGRPKTRRMDSVKANMNEQGVNDKIAADRANWTHAVLTPKNYKSGLDDNKESFIILHSCYEPIVISVEQNNLRAV